MAMVKCRECKKDMSSTAAACPHCGAKPPKQTSGCAWIALVLIAVPFLMMVILGVIGTAGVRQAREAEQAQKVQAAKVESERLAKLSPEERAAEEKKATEAAIAAAERLERESADREGRIWQYQVDNDPMDGRTESAWVKSSNTVDLEFPYNGAQRGMLILRKHPRHGLDVIFRVERGQLLCRSGDCPVVIKYDEGSPSTVSGNEPADNSSEVVFMPNAEGMIGRLKKAKSFKLQVNVYQNGAQTFEFNTAGLEWPIKKK